jgi:hypothetical protein
MCEVTIGKRQDLSILMQISHLSKLFKNVQKMENMNSMPLFMPKKPQYIHVLFNLKRPLLKTIFINNHAMCSMIISYCCNHLNNMLMSVKLIIIQLELNDIGNKLVFHRYSKSTSNTWYTLIWKSFVFVSETRTKQERQRKGQKHTGHDIHN